MTHDIAAPDPKGSKTGHSGAYGPSWDPDDEVIDDPENMFSFMSGEVLSDLDERRYQRMRQVPSTETQSRTLTVRFTYKRKGHPRAALEAVLAGISKTVFETEILDEH